MKTFNEDQMGDPWGWCLSMIEKHKISSKMLSDAIDAPRSTIRSLYNGSNRTPRYELLTEILLLCINLENGKPAPWDKTALEGALTRSELQKMIAVEEENHIDNEPDMTAWDFL